jgi:hypothetical protein
VIDLESTILAQYANSPVLLALVTNMNTCIDPTANLNNFYNQVRNVVTAQGYGLDVWGRIVGVQRTITLPSSMSAMYLRESAAGSPLGPGGSAPLWDGSLSGTNFRLSDDAFRSLILTKALSNISLCSAQTINQQLRNLFGPRCYAVDMGGMRMQIVFENTLSLVNLYILTQSSALARPAGVQAWILTGWAPNTLLGFREAGSTSQPLSYGPFFSGNYLPISY